MIPPPNTFATSMERRCPTYLFSLCDRSQQQKNQFTQPRHRRQDPHARSNFDARKDGLDPGRVLGALEHIQWFGERQVGHDIESVYGSEKEDTRLSPPVDNAELTS